MTPVDRARLVKLLGLLGSDQDGERAAAAKAADELVKRHGMTWDGVVKLCAPAPTINTQSDPNPYNPGNYQQQAAAARQQDDFAAEYVRQAEAAVAQQAMNAAMQHNNIYNQQSAEPQRPSIFESIFGKGF